MEIWTKERLDNYLDECGGCSVSLLDNNAFPFTDGELELIHKEANGDMTDSEFCDYIIEVALEHITLATLKRLGKHLVENGFTPEHVIDVFHQSDEYYQPIMHIDLSLEKAIADFCEIEKIEFTEFLGTFNAEDLF